MKIRIALAAIVTLSFIAFIYYTINYKIRPPQRLSSIPPTAFWVGGSDGGQWYNIVRMISRNKFKIAIYNDFTGQLDVDTTFILNKECDIKEMDSLHLVQKINFYDGERIFLKDKVGSKYCFLSVE
jgi:hypothetical protein